VLHSPEVNAEFAGAGYFKKTLPIKARQVPAGTTEMVIVNSGATRDTAVGDDGDWICTSHGLGEDYVVHGLDFSDIYHDTPTSDGLYVPQDTREKWRKLIKLRTNVVFVAPWGYTQAIEKGGYLIERKVAHGPRAGVIERYGIAQEDAEPDYQPVAAE